MSAHSSDVYRTHGTLRPLYWTLFLVSLIPLCVVLPMVPVKVGIAVIIAWIAMLWTAISLARGHLHYVLPVWVAVYPYCYYFLSFPAQKSIFTIDRALVILLTIEMIAVSRHHFEGVPLTRDLQISACLWGLYLFLCFLSLAWHNTSEVLPSYRLLIDGMLMPAVLGLYAIRYFPAVADLKKLHTCGCILGIGLFFTGLFELITGIDLLPWGGSEPMFTGTHLRRADGPFEQQIVLSMVAILAFFFILSLWRLISLDCKPGSSLLHKCGCVASLGAALLPLNRGLIFALIPIAIIDWRSKDRLIPRRSWALFFFVILISMLSAKLFDPLLYEDRVSSPDNVYQRLAQHQETLNVVREYPLLGVGFDQYHDVASRNPRYMTRWKGIESMNLQHNVLMTILSDQGIIGLLLYIGSQVFLIRAMWRIRGVYPAGWLAFLYCVFVYVFIGLNFGTVYFSDINLFYILVLSLIYQMQARLARKELGLPQALSTRQLQAC